MPIDDSLGTSTRTIEEIPASFVEEARPGGPFNQDMTSRINRPKQYSARLFSACLDILSKDVQHVIRKSNLLQLV
ncbi:MAG: hypothetical protein ACRD9S_02625 [Pyrinomonadaceae bacterium]